MTTLPASSRSDSNAAPARRLYPLLHFPTAVAPYWIFARHARLHAWRVWSTISPSYSGTLKPRIRDSHGTGNLVLRYMPTRDRSPRLRRQDIHARCLYLRDDTSDIGNDSFGSSICYDGKNGGVRCFAPVDAPHVVPHGALHRLTIGTNERCHGLNGYVAQRSSMPWK